MNWKLFCQFILVILALTDLLTIPSVIVFVIENALEKFKEQSISLIILSCIRSTTVLSAVTLKTEQAHFFAVSVESIIVIILLYFLFHDLSNLPLPLLLSFVLVWAQMALLVVFWGIWVEKEYDNWDEDEEAIVGLLSNHSESSQDENKQEDDDDHSSVVSQSRSQSSICIHEEAEGKAHNNSQTQSFKQNNDNHHTSSRHGSHHKQTTKYHQDDSSSEEDRYSATSSTGSINGKPNNDSSKSHQVHFKDSVSTTGSKMNSSMIEYHIDFENKSVIERHKTILNAFLHFDHAKLTSSSKSNLPDTKIFTDFDIQVLKCSIIVLRYKLIGDIDYEYISKELEITRKQSIHIQETNTYIFSLAIHAWIQGFLQLERCRDIQAFRWISKGLSLMDSIKPSLKEGSLASLEHGFIMAVFHLAMFENRIQFRKGSSMKKFTFSFECAFQLLNQGIEGLPKAHYFYTISECFLIYFQPFYTPSDPLPSKTLLSKYLEYRATLISPETSKEKIYHSLNTLINSLGKSCCPKQIILEQTMLECLEGRYKDAIETLTSIQPNVVESFTSSSSSSSVTFIDAHVRFLYFILIGLTGQGSTIPRKALSSLSFCEEYIPYMKYCLSYLSSTPSKNKNLTILYFHIRHQFLPMLTLLQTSNLGLPPPPTNDIHTNLDSFLLPHPLDLFSQYVLSLVQGQMDETALVSKYDENECWWIQFEKLVLS